MISVEVSTVIARAPADVFAFVADMRNEPRWHVDVERAWLTDHGEVAKGSTFGFKLFKNWMGTSEGFATVSEYEPARRVAFDGTLGKMRSTIVHSVTPEGTGTRFTRRIEFPLHGPMRLATPAVRRMVRKANTGFLANLKSVLEGA